MPMFAVLLLAACGPESVPASDATADAPPPATAPAQKSVRAQAATPETARAVPARAESLEAFWTRFSGAALAGDAAAIRSMSAPVVLQRGLLDDTPVVRLPAARVPAIVARVLALAHGADDAGPTQRDLLEATPVPKRDPEQPVDRHHFRDLVFEQGPRGWRLTELYYEE